MGTYGSVRLERERVSIRAGEGLNSPFAPLTPCTSVKSSRTLLARVRVFFQQIFGSKKNSWFRILRSSQFKGWCATIVGCNCLFFFFRSFFYSKNPTPIFDPHWLKSDSLAQRLGPLSHGGRRQLDCCWEWSTYSLIPSFLNSKIFNELRN